MFSGAFRRSLLARAPMQQGFGPGCMSPRDRLIQQMKERQRKGMLNDPAVYPLMAIGASQCIWLSFRVQKTPPNERPTNPHPNTQTSGHRHDARDGIHDVLLAQVIRRAHQPEAASAADARAREAGQYRGARRPLRQGLNEGIERIGGHGKTRDGRAGGTNEEHVQQAILKSDVTKEKRRATQGPTSICPQSLQNFDCFFR